uniref:Uncharacterized protein n=1 Tax=Anguilla anguilla TaxID=7936 RepID=A0A0E9X320_ANGAN
MQVCIFIASCVTSAHTKFLGCPHQHICNICLPPDDLYLKQGKLLKYCLLYSLASQRERSNVPHSFRVSHEL